MIPSWESYEAALQQTQDIQMSELEAALKQAGFAIVQHQLEGLHGRLNEALRRYVERKLWYAYLAQVSTTAVIKTLDQVRANAARMRHALHLKNGSGDELPELLMSLLREQGKVQIRRDIGLAGLRPGEWIEISPSGISDDAEFMAGCAVRQAVRGVMLLEQLARDAKNHFEEETRTHRESKRRHRGDREIKDLYLAVRGDAALYARKVKTPDRREGAKKDQALDTFVLQMFKVMSAKLAPEAKKLDNTLINGLNIEAEGLTQLDDRVAKSRRKSRAENQT